MHPSFLYTSFGAAILGLKTLCEIQWRPLAKEVLFIMGFDRSEWRPLAKEVIFLMGFDRSVPRR
jgi:hypothetical protein